MKHGFFTTSFFVLGLWLSPQAQQVADFENLELAPNTYWNGAPVNEAPFSSGDASFENKYVKSQWGSFYWSKGFAYSNKTDVSTAGYLNMYSAITGKGVNGSSNYIVSQNNSVIRFQQYPYHKPVTGLYITNGTYAALSMQSGDDYAKKFGGASGDDKDFFRLTITGFAQGQELAQKVTFYLADFRNDDNSKDYIVKTWKWVDLSTLGAVDSLKFSLSSSDVGEYGINTPLYFCIDNFDQSYYADKVGTPTSDAIYTDSSIIKSWAHSATIQRGYQNIADKSLGLTTVGRPESALDKADGSVVSLGDSGVAILSFERYISNGTGPDFAIFENGLVNSSTKMPFLELAKVAVSSDGIHFVEFPAISNTQDTVQVDGFASVDAKYFHNLAGKYQAKYGTPFDLEDLKDSALVDIHKISHLKITDVVGHIGTFASRDLNGNAINEPWSTPFASSGFDLDAVGVINEGDVVSNVAENNVSETMNLYPNPASDFVKVSGYVGNLEILSNTGQAVKAVNVNEGYILDISDLSQGLYLVKMQDKLYKLVKK